MNTFNEVLLPRPWYHGAAQNPTDDEYEDPPPCDCETCRKQRSERK
jgi:hypothetical protein